MKLHTGDSVIVISGKYKNKTGTVMSVFESEQRVIVSGINIRTRHIKKTAQQAGQIIKYEASLHASNVMVLDPKTKKGTRVGYKIDEKGNKIRIAKTSGETIIKVKPKKTPAKKEAAECSDKSKAEKAKTADTAAAPKKQPFWNRMKFGATEGDTAEEPRSKKDHTIAEQNIPRKSAGRGA